MNKIATILSVLVVSATVVSAEDKARAILEVSLKIWREHSEGICEMKTHDLTPASSACQAGAPVGSSRPSVF